MSQTGRNRKGGTGISGCGRAKEQTAKCHALTNAITNIKGNPESVWRELERFEETVIFLDEHKDPEAEARRTEQETEKARSQADQAIWQIDEIRAKREEE
ncbi:MAG: hypothetical protein ACLU8D_09710 [Enterocloster sp.]